MAPFRRLRICLRVLFTVACASLGPPAVAAEASASPSVKSADTAPVEAIETRAEALSAQADTAYRAGQFAEAIARAKEALDLLGDSAPALRAGLYDRLSKAHLRSNEWEEALVAAEQERALALTVGDPKLLANSLLQYGAIFLLARDFEKAIQYEQDALLQAEKSGDSDAITNALNHLAVLYWQMEDYVISERYLRRALASVRDNEQLRALLINNIGVALMEQGRYDEAEKALIEAQSFLQTDPDPYFATLVGSNFADLAQRRGHPEESLKLSAEVMEKGREINNLYVQARTERHRGNALVQLNRLEEAETAYNASIEFARTLNDPKEEMETREKLFKLYESSGRYHEALDAYRALQAMREEILSAQVRFKGIMLDIQYETARTEQALVDLRREKQIADLAAERERLEAERSAREVEVLRERQQTQRFQRNMILLGFAIVLFLLVALYSRFRFRQRAFREIAEKHDALTVSQRKLEQANADLHTLNQEKDDILSIAAHDLQTPLVSQRGYAELLCDGWESLSSTEFREFTGAILTSTETMQSIILNLLESHRLEQGAISLSPKPIDPREAIRQSVDQLLPEAQRKRQTIEVESPAALPLVEVDPHYFERILQNLLSNAIKYSPLATLIRVTAETIEPDRVRFSIVDQGPGVTPEEQPLLFQKFAKLSNRTTSGEASTGLGLSIVKRLVEMQGGTVGVHSIPGQGSTFYVTFPIAQKVTPIQ